MENFKKQEALKPYFEKSYGYAVFGTVAKGAIFFVGAAGGKGDVYVNNKDGTEKKVGECTLIEVNAGFELGGTVYSEIIFFETEKDFENFTTTEGNNFEFKGEAQAVGLTASASTSLSTIGNQGITAGTSAEDTQIGTHDCVYVKGMKVYTLTLGGLMYQAAVAGQKFMYQAI